MVTKEHLIGRELGDRYEIEREIGEGASAIVYLARDIRHNRSVALKVLKPQVGSVLGGSRFLSEIETIARLQHPNILPLYDSGEVGSLLFFVMPYLDGKTLRDRLTAERQLPLADIAKITNEVAQALTHAHAQGVVHRDIKPENILFTDGVAVLADFGISRAMTVASGERLTQSGMVLGTPQYMSPEQGAGDAVDGRSDVYSLACVVYEMLTGDPPFTGASPMGILARHARDPVPSVRTIRPAVPKALEAAVMRALGKVPADRFESARAFSDAVTASTVAEPVSGASRSSRRTVVAGWIMVAVLLAVGATAMYQRRGTSLVTDGPPRIIVLPFEHVGPTEDKFIADGMSDEVTSRVAGISGLSVIARTSALHYSAAGTNLAQVGREMNVAYAVTGTVRTDRTAEGTSRVRVTAHLIRVQGQQEIWSEPFDANFSAGDLFAMQSDIAGRVAGKLGVSLLTPEQAQLAKRPTNNIDAYTDYLRGNALSSRRYEEESARGAVDMYQRAVSRDSNFALAWAKLAEAQTIYSYYYRDKVADRLKVARSAIDRAAALDSSLIEVHLARGYLYWWGELNAERALQEFSVVNVAQPNNSEVLWIIGQVQRRKGQYAEALATMKRAAALDPRSQPVALDLATTSMAMRRYDESAAQMERAITLGPDWAPARVMKAVDVLLATGDGSKAGQVVQDALPSVSMREMLKWMYRYPRLPSMLGGAVRDSTEALDAAAPFVDPAKLYLAKAFSYRVRGDAARMRTAFDSARQVLEKRVALAPGDVELHALLGVAYAGLGRQADARREGDGAVRNMPITKDMVMAGTILNHRIDIAVLGGDADGALANFDTVVRIPSQFSRAVLRSDPFYSVLRANSRYSAIATAAEIRY